MKGPLLTLWLGTTLACALAVGWATLRYDSASFRARSEIAALEQTSAKIEQLASLPSTTDIKLTGDQGTLASRAASALSSSGLPRTSLEGLSPESARTIRGSDAVTVARLGATLVISPVTLPELGRFLQSWRLEAPEWVVSELSIKPVASASAEPGGDLPLRVIVKVESIQVRVSVP